MSNNEENKDIDIDDVENKNKGANNELIEWIKSFAIAIVAALIIKMFLFDSTKIDGASMYPTLNHNDRLFVNKIGTHLFEPKHGSIVVFHAPDANKDYIKRVIGLPGDVIEIYNGQVFVNGTQLEETYIEQGIETMTGDTFVWEVPEEEYFVMGDNRRPGESKDSRVFGCIEREKITSYVLFRYYPLDEIGGLKGN